MVKSRTRVTMNESTGTLIIKEEMKNKAATMDIV